MDHPPQAWPPGADELDGWLAGLAADDAAARRRHRHWHQQIEAEEATLVGLLAGLVERAEPVVVRLRAGHETTGVPLTLARDALVLRAGARLSLVALRAVAWVRTAPVRTGAAETTGPAAPPAPAHTLATLLAGLCDLHPAVVVRTGAETLAGRLVAVGHDLVTLSLPGGGTAYTSVSSLDAVTLGSG